jgi:hypothetical protein
MTRKTKLSIALLLEFVSQPIEEEAINYLVGAYNCSREEAKQAYNECEIVYNPKTK